MKFNKKGFTLIDIAISVVLLWFITLLFSSWNTIFIKNSKKTITNYYNTLSLNECAEVIHSIRYGYMDRDISLWWEQYLNDYPTWLYKLSYNDINHFRELNPIYRDISAEEHYLWLLEMLNITWYTDDTLPEQFTIWTEQWVINRYVFLNNNTESKSIVQCFSKYDTIFNLKEYSNPASDFYNYEELKFIMTDYL